MSLVHASIKKHVWRGSENIVVDLPRHRRLVNPKPLAHISKVPTFAHTCVQTSTHSHINPLLARQNSSTTTHPTATKRELPVARRGSTRVHDSKYRRHPLSWTMPRRGTDPGAWLLLPEKAAHHARNLLLQQPRGLQFARNSGHPRALPACTDKGRRYSCSAC